MENVKYGFAFDSTAHKLGLHDGDKVISFDGGKKFKSIDHIGMEMLIENAKSVEVERKGTNITLPIPSSIYKEILANKDPEFATPLVPAIVDSLLPQGALVKAGGKVGDKIIQLDSVPIQ